MLAFCIAACILKFLQSFWFVWIVAALTSPFRKGNWLLSRTLWKLALLRWIRVLAMWRSVAEFRLRPEFEIGGCLWVTDKRHSREDDFHGGEKVGQ